MHPECKVCGPNEIETYWTCDACSGRRDQPVPRTTSQTKLSAWLATGVAPSIKP